MSQHPRRPTRKPAQKTKTTDPPQPAPSPEPSPHSLPPAPIDRSDWAIAHARNAVTIAAHTKTTSDKPVPIPGAFQLDTGLVDYGMWIEMFTQAAPPTEPHQTYRRGRIWA
jgi:cyanobactin cluster PatC/TenC/TruC protein